MKNKWLLFCFIGGNLLGADSAWERWLNEREGGGNPAVVQNREFLQESRFQVGLSGGLGERRDLHNEYYLSLSGRYHFSERHSWEFVRVVRSFFSDSGMVEDIRSQTGFFPDVQLSQYQVNSSYLFSPIYGKYAWGTERLVHFNGYVLLSGGVRFARDVQPFVEAGLGMNHYLGGTSFSLVPELRYRIYRERRSTTVVVGEILAGLGAQWLF